MSSAAVVPLVPARSLRRTAVLLVIVCVVAEPLVLAAMIANPSFFLRGMMLQGAIIGALALAAWLAWMPRATLLLDTEQRSIRYDRVSSRRVPFSSIARVTLGGSERSAWLVIWDGADSTIAQVHVIAGRRSSLGMPQRAALAELLEAASAPGLELHDSGRPGRQLLAAGTLVATDAAAAWLRDPGAAVGPDALTRQGTN
ncbi:hypothetical protein SAMN04489806_0795 [Paramicrobacterium humi]|uniref:PH domain-containing protein n=1 Tax=Paramicrobacterium humi TaxID=640635 RepID=A0A1H4JP68_9MICO|nr:hypothetical protein [Microbacterium humi]SEB48053.1 hypothetical protein SAMN04489806_0795 [Microbacterium humi]